MHRFSPSPGSKVAPRYKVVLGPQQPSHILELPAGQHDADFYAEGLSFPDAGFPGFISFSVSLLDTSKLVGVAGGAQLGRWAWPRKGVGVGPQLL